MNPAAWIAGLAGLLPAHAGLTQHDLAAIGARPPPFAAAPLGLGFLDERGARLTLGQALGDRPAVLVFADYRCNYLCGPGLSLTAQALDQTGLRPGKDYSLVVVGLRPGDGPAQARAMRAQRLRPGAGSEARLLSSGRADVAAAALGYHYVYDPQLGQYAHDASAYVLAPGGAVARVVPEFSLTAPALKQALDDAHAPAAGVLAAPFRVLCYCLQPLTGAYDGPVVLALKVAGIGAVAALALTVAMLLRRRERTS